MILPPSILRLRVVEGGRKRVDLWLPLFLIWPVLAAAWVALLPVSAVVAVVHWKEGWGRRLLLGGPLLFYVFCRLRGLRVEVEEPETDVRIYLW